MMVAKVDKGERVGEWKGPLIGVRWVSGEPRVLLRVEDGARRTWLRDGSVVREARKEGGRSREKRVGAGAGGGGGWQQQRGRGERPIGRAGGRLVGRMTGGSRASRNASLIEARGQ